MTTSEHRALSVSGPSRQKPEKLSAIGVGAVVVGGCAWALSTLPIQAAFILTAAGSPRVSRLDLHRGVEMRCGNRSAFVRCGG